MGSEMCIRDRDWKTYINPVSLEKLGNCLIEPDLTQAGPGERFQFERLGYFCADREDWQPDAPVFNRIVTLRDTWAKISKK